MQSSGHPEFQLDRFLPYRFNRLGDRMSRSLAGVYAERFGLTVAQWRIVATLAEFPGLRASAVAERCDLDKVKVSRAVGDLEDRNLLIRKAAADDGRASELHLSAHGRALFQEIAPLALGWEEQLLADLDAAELHLLWGLLDRLERTIPGDVSRQAVGEARV